MSTSNTATETNVLDAGADAADDAADASAADATPPAKKRSGELAHFFTAIDGLADKTRKTHVRMLWLGDSHGQADFWSGALRSRLQKRFGNGGPGFIHLGFSGYRHDGVELGTKEKWYTTPKAPSTSVATSDGIFGLGGLRTRPRTPGAEVGAEITDASASQKLLWDLCYRLNKPIDALKVLYPGGQLSLTNKKTTTFPSALLHETFSSDAGAPLSTSKSKRPGVRVIVENGSPELCGVVAETDPAGGTGIVLDVAGINGARYTTALAWDETAWLAEFERRSPSLVILEYGTNESGDVSVAPEKYADHLTRVVARIRKKKPDTDFLVLAPTDRTDQSERTEKVTNVLRDAAKANVCAFWDTFAVMGGKGGMAKWQSEGPARGAKDGIHLTVKGYIDLGNHLADDLIRRYEK